MLCAEVGPLHSEGCRSCLQGCSPCPKRREGLSSPAPDLLIAVVIIITSIVILIVMINAVTVATVAIHVFCLFLL